MATCSVLPFRSNCRAAHAAQQSRIPRAPHIMRGRACRCRFGRRSLEPRSPTAAVYPYSDAVLRTSTIGLGTVRAVLCHLAATFAGALLGPSLSFGALVKG